jgi:hypothetical protein
VVELEREGGEGGEEREGGGGERREGVGGVRCCERRVAMGVLVEAQCGLEETLLATHCDVTYMSAIIVIRIPDCRE